MQTLADIFAVGSSLSFTKKGDDKPTEYKLRPPTLTEQGEYQRWLEQRAHDAVDRSSAGEEAKDRRHAIIDRDAALGKYEWDGPIAQESLWAPAGMAKVLQIVCRDQGVTGELAEEMLRHNIREVAAKMLQVAIKDPKLIAPALAALGLPIDWFESEQNEPSSSNSSTPPSTGASANSADSPTTSCSSSTPSLAAPMG